MPSTLPPPLSSPESKRSGEARVISVASGKGGVGKTVIATNLALDLAQRGLSVVLVDLDVGGPDVHTMLGEYSPTSTLADFISRRVHSIDDVAYDLLSYRGLRFVPGCGQTLATANMSYATKKKIIQKLRRIDADSIVIDVGAGTGFHALDFFLMADQQVGVATGDPSSVLDLHRFLKLAAMRCVTAAFKAGDPFSKALRIFDPGSIHEIYRIAEDFGCKDGAVKALAGYRPMLLLNRVGNESRTASYQLRRLLENFFGRKIDLLGMIPEDEEVRRSVHSHLPLLAAGTVCPAADEMRSFGGAMLDRLESRS